MKAFVTKFLFPESKHEIEMEHEDDCPACKAANNPSWEIGSLGFFLVEIGSRKELRRVVKVNEKPNEFFCIIVSEDEARNEIFGGKTPSHVEEAMKELSCLSPLLRPLAKHFFKKNDGSPSSNSNN